MITAADPDFRSLRLRGGTGDDYDAFARLFSELGTGDPVPGRPIWERDIAPGSVVAEGDGGIVGYIFFQAYPDRGFVRNLVVAPHARVRGVGRRLLEAARETLRARGLRRWALNVKRENAAAIALYERAGFAAAYETPVVRADWSIVDRLPRESLEVEAVRFEAADAAPIERALSLFEGALSAPAGELGRIALVLFERGAPERILGATVFAPAIPGARPFRIVRPTLAAPLLEAIAPYRGAADTYIQLVLESDPELYAALRKARARLHLDIVLYEGDL